MSENRTPTLDKFRLHPIGGAYCTCFSTPWASCEACKRAREYVARWDALSPENRKKAEAEYEREYPRTTDLGGR